MANQNLSSGSTSQASEQTNLEEWKRIKPLEREGGESKEETSPAEEWIPVSKGKMGREFTPMLEQKGQEEAQETERGLWSAAARTVSRVPKLLASGVTKGVAAQYTAAASRSEQMAEMYEDRYLRAGEEDYVSPLHREIAKLPGREKTEEELQEQGKLQRKVAEEKAQESFEHMQRHRTQAEELKAMRKHVPGHEAEAENLFEAVVESMGMFAPSMIAQVGAGPLVGFAQMSSVSQGMAYEDLRSNGVAKDKAFDISMLTGHAIGFMEMLGTGFTVNQLGKMIAHSAGKVGVSKATAEAFARFAGVTGAESVEEYFQSYPEAAARVAAENPEASGEELVAKFREYIKTEEARKERWRSMKAGAIGGALFGGAPLAVRGTQDLAAGIPGKLRSKKYAEEGVEARQRLVDAYWRGEETGKGGLQAEHPIAQYNMDLYNKLYRPEGSFFEKMEREEAKREEEDAATLDKAKKILEKQRRGRGIPEPSERPAEPTREAEEQRERIRRKDGGKFKSKQGAMAVRRREGLEESHEVVGSKEEGFELAPKELEEAEAPEISTAQAFNEVNQVDENLDLGVYGDWTEETQTGNEEVDQDVDTLNKNYSNSNVAEVEEAKEGLQKRIKRTVDEGSLQEKLELVDQLETLNEEDAADLKDIFRIEESGQPVSPDLAAFRTNLVRKLAGEHIPDQAELSSAVEDSTTEEAFEGQPEDWLPTHLDPDPNSVKTLMDQYEERGWNNIQENPELFIGYLINQVNAWVHGIASPDISKIKDALGRMRDEADNLYPYFGSQTQLNEFIETVEKGIELTEQADELRNRRDELLTFRMSLGPDVFYPSIRNAIGRIQGWRGKVNAKAAWDMLTKEYKDTSKNIPREDLDWSGITDELRKAEREGRKISKEDLLNRITKVPGVQVEIRKADTGAPREFMEWIETVRRAKERPDLFDQRNIEASIRSQSELFGISEEEVRAAVDSEEDPGTLMHRGELSIPKPTAYAQHSHFRNVRPNDYSHEEIVVTLPDAPYDWAKKGVHKAFESPVAFFARVSHDGENFIVEEIQNELATMAAKKGIDIDAPFKRRAWVDLVSSMIAKRAFALGYKKVLFPPFDWVNERWAGQLPKSTKAVYEKQIRQAMNKLGARQVGSKELKDAALTFSRAGASHIAEIDRRLDAGVADLKTLNKMNTALKEPKELLEDALRVFNEPRWGGTRNSIAGRLAKKSLKDTDAEVLKLLESGTIPDNANYRHVLRLLHHMYLEGGSAAVRSMRFEMASNELERRTLTMMVSAYEELMGAQDEVSLAAIDERVDIERRQELEDAVFRAVETFGDNNSVGALQEVVKKIDREIEEATSETREFYQFRLPDTEPEPETYALTCKMGFDPTDAVRMLKNKGKKLAERGAEKALGAAEISKAQVHPDRKLPGRKVQKAYNEVEKEAEGTRKGALKEFYRKTQAATYDVTGPLKGLLKKTFGEHQARKVINQLILAKGHSVRASRFLNRKIGTIYGGLNHKEREVLNRVIFSSRMIQIGRYKRNVKDYKGLSPQDHRNWLTYLEENAGVPRRKAHELFWRAEKYFEATHELLELMKEEGVISKEDFDSMSKFQWTRTEMLDKIDPKMKTEGLSVGARESRPGIRDSGIKDLELGNETDSPQMDMMYVLADWTNRVMKRIHMTRLNKELWDTAMSNPKNGVLIPGGQGVRKPRDWKKLEMVVEGKKRTIYAPPEFSRWWLLDVIGVTPGVANFLRVVSGSAVLRPMATGIRLGFIPVNMIKDLTLMWHASKYMDEKGKWQPVYDRFLPVAMYQQAKDLGKVAPSAAIRGKKYEDYVNAGGGFSFLAVQGRPFEGAETAVRYGRNISTKLGHVRRGAQHLGEAFSYLNETSEILTRLMSTETALRRIAKREGISLKEAREDSKFYQEAVSIAKDYLDFSQHGTLTKTVDQVIPYLNAQVQVGRTYARAWRRDWRTAAVQHAQVALLGAMFYGAAKHYMSDEGEDITKDIGAWEWANNFIMFPFGVEMYFENADGEKIYPYFKIPLDGPMVLAKMVGELGAAYIMGEEFRGDVVKESLKTARSLANVAPTRIPISAAYDTYVQGVDSFFGGRVWPYDEAVKYGERYIEGETPQFFQDMAEWSSKVLPGEGVSAHHLSEAAKDVFTNGNYLTTLAGKAYDSFRDVPQADKEIALMEALAKFPTTKGIVGLTRPGAYQYDMIEESEQEIATTSYMHKNKVRALGKQYREEKAGRQKGDATTTRRKLHRYIRKEASQHLSESGVEELYDLANFYIITPRLPHFSTWERLMGKRPRTRARIFHEELSQYKKGSENWEQLWREIQLFPSIATDEFWSEYDKIRQGRVEPRAE